MTALITISLIIIIPVVVFGTMSIMSAASDADDYKEDGE